MTAQDLVTGTLKVLPDAVMKGRSAPGMKILNIKKTVYKGTGLIKFSSTVSSQQDPTIYKTQVDFSGLKNADTDRPDAGINKCQVRCSCPSFYFYFGYWDKQNGALSGPSQTPYVRKTQNVPERNPKHIPGVCKHLMRMLLVMKNERIITGSGI